MYPLILYDKVRVEVRDMNWQIVVALVVAIPVILFPVAFVWYLNIGGAYQAIRKLMEERKSVRVRENLH